MLLGLEGERGAEMGTLGGIEIKKGTEVDRLWAAGTREYPSQTKLTFPLYLTNRHGTRTAFNRWWPGGVSTMSLDRLQAMFFIENALKIGWSVPVKNELLKYHILAE